MTDSTIIKYSGDWTLYQGVVADSARLFVYDAGTSDLASIYPLADLTGSITNPVVADPSGLMPFAYKGTGAYKVILKTKTATDITIDSEDLIPGALDTSTFAAATFAKPDTDCAADTGDTTLTTSHLGTVRNGNCTSATFTYTLPSAVTATNGRGYTIRHTGTANQIKIATVSSQTITTPATGVTVTGMALVAYGESVTLVSDGAGWHVTASVPALMRPNTPGIIQITDRVSSAPGAPTPGARYIVSGAYDTFEQEDIIEYDGTNYIEYTPPTDCGWVAYVQDEDAYYSFIGSAWVCNTATAAQQVTGTALTTFVTPGRQHYHISAAKVLGRANASAALTLNYNLTSVTDDGTGLITFTIANDFSDGAYTIAPSIEKTASAQSESIKVTSQAAGAFSLASERGSDGADIDPTNWIVSCHGTLA